MSGIPPGRRFAYAGAAVGGNILDMAVVTWALYYYAPPPGDGPALAPIGWISAAMAVGRVIDATCPSSPRPPYRWLWPSASSGSRPGRRRPRGAPGRPGTGSGPSAFWSSSISFTPPTFAPTGSCCRKSRRATATASPAGPSSLSFGRAFPATLRNRSFVVYLTATVLALLAQNMLYAHGRPALFRDGGHGRGQDRGRLPHGREPDGRRARSSSSGVST